MALFTVAEGPIDQAPEPEYDVTNAVLLAVNAGAIKPTASVYRTDEPGVFFVADDQWLGDAASTTYDAEDEYQVLATRIA